MTLLGQDSQTLYGEMIERVIKLEDALVVKLYIDSAPLEENYCSFTTGR
jgi:chemotaxis regulatin CheY-phosphate phosphatase CheZ